MLNPTITQRMDELRTKYGDFAEIEDYRVFTAMCIRDFFVLDSGEPFDPDDVLDWITDGANDGGIDAIFNDPNSDENDIIIVQSKYYTGKIKPSSILTEILKIYYTIKNLEKGMTEGLNGKVVSQYVTAKSKMGQNGTIRVFFFTSGSISKGSKASFISKVAKGFFELEIETLFEEEIIERIIQCESGSSTIAQGELVIDDENNLLHYDNSIIANISAASLKTLFLLKREALFGLNLRYYFGKAEVDREIRKSIKSDNRNFWYKNNGIVIVCDGFEIQGRILKLKNFSIINGCQTTSLIGHSDFEEDFFLHCKVVVSKAEDELFREEFAASIAVASNTQKPIKPADLRATAPEQIDLKKRLANEGVTYLTKTGEKGKTPDKCYLVAKMELIGKMGLAAILQMPGTARSQSTRMFQEDFYPLIFGEQVPAGVLADSLKLQHYYMEFVKKHRKDPDYDDVQKEILVNGFTFQLAIISLFGKIKNVAFTYGDINEAKNDTESIRELICSNGKMKHILIPDIEKEENILKLENIFTGINNICLFNSFQVASEAAKNAGSKLKAADFLKYDRNYYKCVINQAWYYYNNYYVKPDFDSILQKN